MRRLQRRSVKPPPDWAAKVDAAFADAAAFWKKAKAFEKLPEHGAKRKKGFVAYAPEVLPVDAKGKRGFPEVWGSDEVRQAIAGMSHGFCAYCESAVSSSHPGARGEERPPGQVEHFKPKSRFPAQAYALKNYFLGCMGCNGAKHDKWPRGGYVRPDEGKPGSRFVFAESGEVEAREGDEQAANTVEDFGLNRYWLAYHRKVTIAIHMRFVRMLIGHPGARLEALLLKGPAQFSEAINQNVWRAWAKGKRKKKAAGARPRSGRPKL